MDSHYGKKNALHCIKTKHVKFTVLHENAITFNKKCCITYVFFLCHGHMEYNFKILKDNDKKNLRYSTSISFRILICNSVKQKIGNWL